MTNTSSYAAEGSDVNAAIGSDYVELTPSFVVNLRDGNQLRFLKVNVQLKLSANDAREKVMHHDSVIRHSMILLLSGLEANSLYSATGKEELRKQALKEITTALMEKIEEPVIKDIYFTNFIIQ